MAAGVEKDAALPSCSPRLAAIRSDARLQAVLAALLCAVAVASRLPSVVGAPLLALALPLTLWLAAERLLPARIERPAGRKKAEGGVGPEAKEEEEEDAEETLEGLVKAVEDAREELAEAERIRAEAMQQSSADRHQIYRKRGELAALHSAEDRVKFLACACEGYTTDERVSLIRANLEACRSCEAQTQDLEGLEAEVSRLQEREKWLEAEIEKASRQQEEEEASKGSLEEETQKLQGQIARARAKFTAQDAQLVHARRELQKMTGDAQTDERRTEASAAKGVEKAWKGVKHEEQELKRRQGERRFVESIGGNLRTRLQECKDEVSDLQERLSQCDAHCEAAEKSIAEKHQEVERLKEQEAAAPAEEVVPAAPAVVEATASGAKGRQKAGKQAKAKKRKDSDEHDPEDAQLEDLELELAAELAGKEEAEQRAAAATADAEAYCAKVQAHVEKCNAQTEDLRGQLEEVMRNVREIEGFRREIDQRLAQTEAQAEAGEKQIKEVEREKIRLRLDLKMAADALRDGRPAETLASRGGRGRQEEVGSQAPEAAPPSERRAREPAEAAAGPEGRGASTGEGGEEEAPSTDAAAEGGEDLAPAATEAGSAEPAVAPGGGATAGDGGEVGP